MRIPRMVKEIGCGLLFSAAALGGYYKEQISDRYNYGGMTFGETLLDWNINSDGLQDRRIIVYRERATLVYSSIGYTEGVLTRPKRVLVIKPDDDITFKDINGDGYDDAEVGEMVYIGRWDGSFEDPVVLEKEPEPDYPEMPNYPPGYRHPVHGDGTGLVMSV